jgi:hypothetical protein
MRGYLTYLWRDYIVPLWRWRFPLVCAGFGLWLFATQPLIPIYPTCLDWSRNPVRMNGEMTAEFREHFGRWLLSAPDITIRSSLRYKSDGRTHYDIRVRLIDWITEDPGRDASRDAFSRVLQSRFRYTSFGFFRAQDRFPHLFAIFREPTCYAFRRLVFSDGAWASGGPSLWATGDPDPMVPSLDRWGRVHQ